MRVYPFMYYVYLLPAAFFAPAIHESVKAMASARLGDPTPKSKGFLTGNPFRYFEPIGFICILIFGYGWGQPVPVSPIYYRDKKRGTIIAFITPSLVNLLVGIASAALMRILYEVLPPALSGAPELAVSSASAALDFLYAFATVNVGLALFNIIPIYPLDGAKILQLFLKPDWAIRFNHYEKIFQIVLIILLGLGLVARAFDPLTQMIIRTVWL